MTILTEAEARKRWCPFARVPGRLSMGADSVTVWTGTQNRGHTMGGALDNTLCLASKCMAWRQRETAEHRARAEAEFKRTGNRMAADTGYCGIAGDPPR